MSPQTNDTQQIKAQTHWWQADAGNLSVEICARRSCCFFFFLEGDIFDDSAWSTLTQDAIVTNEDF